MEVCTSKAEQYRFHFFLQRISEYISGDIKSKIVCNVFLNKRSTKTDEWDGSFIC